MRPTTKVTLGKENAVIKRRIAKLEKQLAASGDFEPACTNAKQEMPMLAVMMEAIPIDEMITFLGLIAEQRNEVIYG